MERGIVALDCILPTGLGWRCTIVSAGSKPRGGVGRREVTRRWVSRTIYISQAQKVLKWLHSYSLGSYWSLKYTNFITITIYSITNPETRATDFCTSTAGFKPQHIKKKKSPLWCYERWLGKGQNRDSFSQGRKQKSRVMLRRHWMAVGCIAIDLFGRKLD
jgi:hypothetical protein